MGRPRKSNKQKVQDGTFRSDRAAKVIALDASIPSCPTWLDDIGKATWQRVTVVMAKVNITFDVELLATFCDTFSHSVVCSERLRLEGYTIDTLSGLKKINPSVNALREFHKTLNETGKLLGLSAGGRQALGLEVQEPEVDPLEEFLKRGKANPNLKSR